MELLHFFADFILHLDRHLVELLMRFDTWIYALMFLVIFAETGLVVTPFLPGDSLLFGLGALAAIDTSGSLSAGWLALLLSAAAVLGNTTNYWIGRGIGQQAFSGRYRFIKVEYLRQTEGWFARHGATAIVLSRFAPIVRTFAPFVAGVGRMHHGRFQAYNIAGGVAWVNLFTWAGYFFGNLPLIRDHFGLVTLGIIAVSMLPMLVMIFRKDHPQEGLKRKRP
ncbi:MAG TPA: DedA family protein [Steroidobacteraceae bacterium]|nr:DedA family protein [Steroidobacteraceae bacterium]